MTTPTVTMKRCPRCGETKSADWFHRNRSNRDGLSAQCKECCRSYQRAYQEAHREQIAAQKRAYYKAHREEDLVYSRDRNALIGDPTMERWQEIAAKHATRKYEPWSEAEDAYLAASTDRIVDAALELKRTHQSVNNRICTLRKRGIELARDAHRR